MRTLKIEFKECAEGIMTHTYGFWELTDDQKADIHKKAEEITKILIRNCKCKHCEQRREMERKANLN